MLKAATIKHHKAKSERMDKFAFAVPCAYFFSGRRAQPVAGERKIAAERSHGRIAGIDVAVEPGIGTLGGLILGMRNRHELGRRKQNRNSGNHEKEKE